MNKVAFSLGLTAILGILALNSAVCWCAWELKGIRTQLKFVDVSVSGYQLDAIADKIEGVWYKFPDAVNVHYKELDDKCRSVDTSKLEIELSCIREAIENLAPAQQRPVRNSSYVPLYPPQ